MLVEVCALSAEEHSARSGMELIRPRVVISIARIAQVRMLQGNFALGYGVATHLEPLDAFGRGIEGQSPIAQEVGADQRGCPADQRRSDARGAHLDDRKALGQRPPAPELVYRSATDAAGWYGRCHVVSFEMRSQ